MLDGENTNPRNLASHIKSAGCSTAFRPDDGDHLETLPASIKMENVIEFSDASENSVTEAKHDDGNIILLLATPRLKQ